MWNSEERRFLAGLRNEAVSHLLLLEEQEKNFTLSNQREKWESEHASLLPLQGVCWALQVEGSRSQGWNRDWGPGTVRTWILMGWRLECVNQVGPESGFRDVIIKQGDGGAGGRWWGGREIVGQEGGTGRVWIRTAWENLWELEGEDLG